MYLSKQQLKERYKNHLKSQYWFEFKRDYLNPYCQNCGSKYNLDGHHVSYQHFGYEKQYPKDMITLCRSCHDKIHFTMWGARRKDWRWYSNDIVKKSQAGDVPDIRALVVLILFLLIIGIFYLVYMR